VGRQMVMMPICASSSVYFIMNLLIEGADRVISSEKFPLLIITLFACNIMNGRCNTLRIIT
jgi:hypothetical protein